MRLRTLIGFGIGYALGARSDTKRFDDMANLVETVKESPIFQAVLQQAQQAAASGMQTLTGQQPSWGGGGGQAESQQGSGQESEQAEDQSEEGEEATDEDEQAKESGNGSGNGGGRSKQRTSSKQSSSSS